MERENAFKLLIKYNKEKFQNKCQICLIKIMKDQIFMNTIMWI